MNVRRWLSLVVVAMLCIALLVTALSVIPSNALSPDVDLPDIADRLTKEKVLRWARIRAPRGDEGVLIHFDFPAETPLTLGTQEIHSLTVDIAPDGGLFVRNATGGDRGSEDVAGACDDPSFLPLGVSWRAGDLPIKWKLNIQSKPRRLTLFATRKSARRAHRVWPEVHTNCDSTSDNGFAWRYRQFTQRRVKRDHVNLVDFGDLGGGALATAYTWYMGNRILESDVRLNKHDYRWTNKPDGNKAYQVVNVVAHELGHSLGLDDLDWPHGGQTMFGRTSKGELKKTTLGRGDIRGARIVSP